MNKEEYLATLDWVTLKSPHHPLLATVQSGYSSINAIYLRSILDGLSDEALVGDDEDYYAVSPDDDMLLSMHREKSTLFTYRAKLSNRFHICNTDTERANVSDEIRLIQDQIGKLMREIRIYQKTGELPDPEPEEVMLTGVQLMKKYRSVVANISYHRRQLNNSAHKQGERISKQKAKWETQLKELEREKLRYERQIASESV